ncbi:unnamed protein product [Brachionus calyciflorus]|uniref:Uncharacterized protein n=1 Tax=Brachionus calyciflorus TaxID=104777 RepID=A0A813ULK3_9BILA|nr:unnamed protein product [Brachionus calyciflorus]
MAFNPCVNLFSKIYEENIKLGNFSFSFEKLAEDLKEITPVKRINNDSLCYDEENLSIFLTSKDCIIRNLCLNPSVQSNPEFSLEILRELYDFLNQQKFSDDSFAQCIFLIHNSKYEFGKKSFLNKILKKFSSIRISSLANQYSNVFHELNSLFDKIISNSFIQKTIVNLIDEIAEKDAVRKTQFDFDFKCLTVKFIDSDFGKLLGFAGKNTVYVNTKPFIKFFTREGLEMYTYDQKILVIKMEFICTIVHEIAHVILRYRLNDLNKSSPHLKKLISYEKEEVEESNEKILKSVDECGLESEKKFFKVPIDWLSSLSDKKLNFEYLNELLKDVEHGQKLDFDSTKTEFLVYDETKLHKMACYFIPSEDFFFKM